MKITKSIVASSFLLVGMTCVSCGDDETESNSDGTPVAVDIKSVFTNGMPKAAADIKSITLDENGRVSAMKTSDASITFEYANVATRSVDKTPKVMMVITEENGWTSTINMTLGSNGFVSQVAQTYYDPLDGTNNESWLFKYNSDGQLTYMKRSEGGNEETFITYTDGDITKVKQTCEEDDDNWEQSILYTSPSVTSPIDNKGCVMLFDNTFGIDMDEMWYAYYAGLLGKATKHLPVGNKDEEETSYYDWKLNANGFPTSVTIDYNTLRFSW